MAADDEFEEHLQALKSKCEQHLVSNSNNVLMTVSWITKALVTRNYPDGMNWLSLLLNSIDNNLQASEAFKTIMDDNYDCLGPKSKSIKTALYQQKVFIYVVNKLLSDISQITKPEYLRTFGYVVGYAPKEVIMMYFKKISKLVLLSLELSNAEILLILLTIIKNIVLSNKNEIEEHLEDYVNRVLNLMQFQGSMKVRVAAVQFITILLSTYPIYKLLPLRKAVLEHLGQSVDDEKRLVRKEAMEARSLWFLLDSPTE